MNNDALNEFAKFMTESLKQAKDFTIEQAPIVCKEVIHQAIAENVMSLVFGLFMLALAYPVYKWVERRVEKQDSYGCWGMGYIFGTLPLIIGGTLATISSISELVKVAIAPRLYLIEYFAHLVKQ